MKCTLKIIKDYILSPRLSHQTPGVPSCDGGLPDDPLVVRHGLLQSSDNGGSQLDTGGAVRGGSGAKDREGETPDREGRGGSGQEEAAGHEGGQLGREEAGGGEGASHQQGGALGLATPSHLLLLSCLHLVQV